jgi:hypothetical protein
MRIAGIEVAPWGAWSSQGADNRWRVEELKKGLAELKTPPVASAGSAPRHIGPMKVTSPAQDDPHTAGVLAAFYSGELRAERRASVEAAEWQEARKDIQATMGYLAKQFGSPLKHDVLVLRYGDPTIAGPAGAKLTLALSSNYLSARLDGDDGSIFERSFSASDFKRWVDDQGLSLKGTLPDWHARGLTADDLAARRRDIDPDWQSA